MSKNAQFGKFINQKSNAARKEKFKQEKKAAKKERAAAIEKRFEEKRQMKTAGRGMDGSYKPAVRLDKKDLKEIRSAAGGEKKAPFKSKTSSDRNRPGAARQQRPADKKPSPINRQQPGSHKKDQSEHQQAGNFKRQAAPSMQQTPADRKPFASHPGTDHQGQQKSFNRKPGTPPSQGSPARQQKPFEKRTTANGRQQARQPKDQLPFERKPLTPAKIPASKKPGIKVEPKAPDEGMPLNKYIAHSGVCSRRDAAELVRLGEVKVNGEIVTEPGTKVSASDEIKVKGKKITPSKNFVYVLLNKPKDYLTTLDDPQGRKTVLDLIKSATQERIYPIGRLDRNTSGVLLFTNDGDLAQTLSHPKHEVKKIYEITLDKPLTKNDFETIMNGITLEDGFIAPDSMAYADAKDRTVIGMEIHSGRNRIVRRIFEHLKYDVRGLDRVMFAGLTKKNVQRGKWRFLAEKEIRILKHFNKGGKK